MSGKAEYGEPWAMEHGRVETPRAEIVTYPGTPGQGDRIVACVNALSGISDPERFMEDVRILYKSHTGPLNRDEYAEMSEAVSRLAAQLKGE